MAEAAAGPPSVPRSVDAQPTSHLVGKAGTEGVVHGEIHVQGREEHGGVVPMDGQGPVARVVVHVHHLHKAEHQRHPGKRRWHKDEMTHECAIMLTEKGQAAVVERGRESGTRHEQVH